ncbi:MAG: RNA polymerase sigma factor, partial [Bacilli bacterium]|nr:RNA polymerase sigma factor [Bacilli bacterium]
YFVILPILKDKQLTEDILQEAYMKMLKNIDRYQEKNFLAYLITIAKNLAINEYNRRKRESFVDTIETSESDYSFMDHVEIKAEKEELIKEMLSALDETEKNVILLYNVENLTHREIAAILDKPLGTVTWIYAKAVKKLKAKFKEGEQ